MGSIMVLGASQDKMDPSKKLDFMAATGMTGKLVHQVWLGCVERAAVVTNVLGTEKDAKGQTVQKVTRRQQTSDGAHAEIGATLEKLADILLLRNLVASVSTMLLHEFQGMKELAARILVSWVTTASEALITQK